MEKAFDVVALGELLIDFTGEGTLASGAPLFAANPGGAPGNVLSLLSGLGKRTAFIGKVGNDMFGAFLRRALVGAGIDGAGLLTDPAARTALAFVTNAPDGEREFSFYRDPGADELLTEDELPTSLLESCRVFHFGTLSMTRAAGRSATLLAARRARGCGAIVSFDPNLRFSLWKNKNDLRDAALAGLSLADAVKVGDDELAFLTGEAETAAGVKALRSRFPNVKLLCLTSGAKGSRCYYEDLAVFAPAFRVNAVDTTGAGDAFWGAALSDVLERGLSGRTEKDLYEMLLFANAAGALVTTRKGAFSSMPGKAEILRLRDESGIPFN